MGGGAWLFLFGGMISLVNSVNEQDLNQLNGHNSQIVTDFLEGLLIFNQSQEVSDAIRCSGAHVCYCQIQRVISLTKRFG